METNTSLNIDLGSDKAKATEIQLCFILRLHISFYTQQLFYNDDCKLSLFWFVTFGRLDVFCDLKEVIRIQNCIDYKESGYNIVSIVVSLKAKLRQKQLRVK